MNSGGFQIDNEINQSFAGAFREIRNEYKDVQYITNENDFRTRLSEW